MINTQDHRHPGGDSRSIYIYGLSVTTTNSYFLREHLPNAWEIVHIWYSMTLD